MKNKNLKGFLIVILIIIFILLFFSFFVKHKPSEEKLGSLPDNYNSETDNNPNKDNEYTYDDNNNEAQPKDVIYPKDVIPKEEVITSGIVPNVFMDMNKNTYTKDYFSSYGYTLYIPDEYKISESDSSYLKNTFYLTPKKDDDEKNAGIQIAVTTKTNLRSNPKKISDVMDLFDTAKNNLEYDFCGNKYIVALYEMGTVQRITGRSIENMPEDFHDSIIYYEDDCKFKIQSELSPSTVGTPYVTFFYVVKDDVAIMITAMGPQYMINQITYLGNTMALNCRELLNQNCTNVETSLSEHTKNKNFTFSYDPDWIKKNDYLYLCSDDRENFLYGTKILIGGDDLLNDESLDNISSLMDNKEKAKFMINTKEIQNEILSALLDNPQDLTVTTMNCITKYITYDENKISECVVGGKKFYKIDYNYMFDETSLRRDLNFESNPMPGSIYFYMTKDSINFVNINYLSRNESYIDSFSKKVLSKINFS